MFSDNHGRNILELCNILVQVLFPTSKSKQYVLYSKLSIRVASRVAKLHNTSNLRDLGNIRKIYVEKKPST